MAFRNFPEQQIPESKKTDKWKRDCVDWADSRTYANYSPVRSSYRHKKINYDLVDGKIHMDDMKALLEAEAQQGGLIPDKIQHYPVMNSKLDLLAGEESSRVFEHRAVITNPTAVADKETRKKQEILKRYVEYLQSNPNNSDSQDQEEIDRINEYFTYNYQDYRERRANNLINHYWLEQNYPDIFTKGLRNVFASSEEIYMVDIVHGEPVLSCLNPLKVHVYRSGFSDNIEDADIIVIEDYISPGRAFDIYGDSFSKEDLEYLKNLPSAMSSGADSMGNIDERDGFIETEFVGEDGIARNAENAYGLMGTDSATGLAPYDSQGNLRIIRVFWKSRRKILKVREFDQETGEEIFKYYPESHQVNENLGEKVVNSFWTNEAWEGTKIGEKIYVNIRPRPIQFNTISNPSKCHFGIIGSVYNINERKPFSLVDRLKPYSYLYDITHHRLNELIATSWGQMIKLDMSKKPEGWSVEKWMHYARRSKILVENPFNEGREGASTGKLAGSLNTASNGVVNADQTQSIRSLMEFLQWISEEMSTVSGVSKQREGSIQNRETVGGVERATMQSAMITKWLFAKHDDVKRRVLNCVLDVAKVCVKGNNEKFKYILDQGSIDVSDNAGDEFSENDYGIVVENSDGAQALNQNIEQIALAAMQAKTLPFSAIMKMYSTKSIMEKERIIDKAEKEMKEQAQQQARMEQEAAAQQQQALMEQKKSDQEFQNMINMRDNETKIRVAEIQAGVALDTAKLNAESKEQEQKPVEEDGNNIALDVAKYKQDEKHHSEDLAEQKREFDIKTSLERSKMAQDKIQNKQDNKMAEKKLEIDKKKASQKPKSTSK